MRGALAHAMTDLEVNDLCNVVGGSDFADGAKKAACGAATLSAGYLAAHKSGAWGESRGTRAAKAVLWGTTAFVVNPFCNPAPYKALGDALNR